LSRFRKTVSVGAEVMSGGTRQTVPEEATGHWSNETPTAESRVRWIATTAGNSDDWNRPHAKQLH